MNRKAHAQKLDRVSRDHKAALREQPRRTQKFRYGMRALNLCKHLLKRREFAAPFVDKIRKIDAATDCRISRWRIRLAGPKPLDVSVSGEPCEILGFQHESVFTFLNQGKERGVPSAL